MTCRTSGLQQSVGAASATRVAFPVFSAPGPTRLLVAAAQLASLQQPAPCRWVLSWLALLARSGAAKDIEI
jgi:hypothetical protein